MQATGSSNPDCSQTLYGRSGDVMYWAMTCRVSGTERLAGVPRDPKFLSELEPRRGATLADGGRWLRFSLGVEPVGMP